MSKAPDQPNEPLEPTVWDELLSTSETMRESLVTRLASILENHDEQPDPAHMQLARVWRKLAAHYAACAAAFDAAAARVERSE